MSEGAVVRWPLCSPCGRLRLAFGVIVPTLLYAGWFACENCIVAFHSGLVSVSMMLCTQFVYILFASIGKISFYHVRCCLWRLF